MFSQFLRDENGNFIIITALSLVPLIVMAGGSLDVLRMTTTSQKLQSALDSATLAAASLTNAQDIETTINEYVAANLPDKKPYTTLDLSIDTQDNALNSRTIEISASVLLDTPFLGLVGMDTQTVSAQSVANQSAENVEIAMVLDISSSMNGSKLPALRDAAKGFVDIMLEGNNKDYTSINYVPFGGTVNIGDFYSQYVVDPDSDPSVIIDPNMSEYDIGQDVSYGKFAFSADAEGCIEYHDDDFGTYTDGIVSIPAIPTDSRSQVPEFTRWNTNNPWCPKDSSKVLLNTNNQSALESAIDAIELSDGTGMDIGALWGAKVLSGSMRGNLGGDFSDRPADFDDEETLKVAVIMTDGEITAQFRPTYDPGANSHINSGFERQTIYSKGGKNTSSTTEHRAVAYFKRSCDFMKQNGVQIYTIGFQISSGSTADSLLNYCASSPSNYYFVEGLNIDDAFDAIAASVNALRITG
ncbi:pilus assembly protein [Roseibium hamelinense]|nr:pilus assembly protein [Roseibium hamelinense]